MGELADTVRRLVDLVVTNTADAEVLDGVVSQLRSAADVLAAHVPTQQVARFVEPPEGLPPRLPASMDGAMPYDPVIGRYNPIALPVQISFEPPLAVGTACFTTPYEGGPGWVHGAALAATFDIVLTAANHLCGAAGPTVWLTIRFLRPTHVGVDARFEAEVVENDGRRVKSRGRLVQDAASCASRPKGKFCRPRPQADPQSRRARPATTRRPPADSANSWGLGNRRPPGPRKERCPVTEGVARRCPPSAPPAAPRPRTLRRARYRRRRSRRPTPLPSTPGPSTSGSSRQRAT